MNEEPDKWQTLLNDLADGKSIDISDQDFDVEDSQLIEQLKSISEIQKVFKQQHVAQKTTITDSKYQNNQQELFTWGHLKVLEQLGEGSFGEVFRAHDPVLNREVALKLIKPNQLASFHAKSFIAEAQRMAQVRNRHVLAIHGASVNDGRAGLWCDLITGQNLRSISRASIDELIAVISALSGALSAVHEAGLVHGDVKAANVMREERNGNYLLMDFGAGLELGEEQLGNQSVGSPILMAPELFEGQNKTPASDIYAMGCLVFKMATGVYPIEAESILDVQQAHLEHAYLNLSKLRPDLPKQLVLLVENMLSRTADNRPKAVVIKTAIEQVRTAPERKRRQRLIVTIMISLVLGIALTSVGFYQAEQARKQAVIEKQKAQAVNDFLKQVLGSAYKFGQGREVRVADMLDLASKSLIGSFKGQPHAMAAISEALGKSYMNLKLDDQGLKHFEISLNLKTKLYGQDHPETLDLMLQKAKVSTSLGDYKTSQELCLSIIQRSPLTAKGIELEKMAQIELANVLGELGEFQKAEDILLKLLNDTLSMENKDSNYPFLARTVLADNYRKQSKFKEALAVIEQAEEWYNNYPSAKPTNEVVITNQKAIYFSELGQLEEAEKAMKKSLALAEQYYGKSNSGYLTALTNLGAILYSQGKVEEALNVQQEALSLSSSVKGHSDMYSIAIGINLANAYVANGYQEEGETLMRNTLLSARSTIGETHIETFRLEYNLAELLNNTGRYQESEALSKSSLDKMKKTLGDSHLITLLTQDNLAISLIGLGHHQEAVKLHQQVFSDVVGAFGEKSPYSLLVRSHLVNSLSAAGKMAQAVQAQQELVTIQIDQLGEDHPEVVKALSLLAKLKQEQP